MYFEWFVVIIGVIGTAANGLVLYALVASKQHKKHQLIVNQNALDLYSCVFLVITYGMKLSNAYLSGSLGYWLCMFIYSENLFYVGVYASWLNLMILSIDRYLKVVHSAWSKKYLRKWMTYGAIAGTWISGVVHEMVIVFQTSAVIDGFCYGYVIGSPESLLALGIYYFLFTYLLVLAIFIFCYGKILMVICRQARVMAGHSASGPSNAQAQSNQKMQSNVIKTLMLVCAFYAVAWLPQKIFVLLIGLDVNLNYANDAYYVILSLGFLYICTTLMIITIKRCLNVVSRVCLSGWQAIMAFKRIGFMTNRLSFLYICANPFVYATKFDPVRRILKGLLFCKKASEPVASSMQMT